MRCAFYVKHLLQLSALAAAVTLPAAAHAARTVEVSFEVTGDPQVAVWLETADGQFVDTIMVTRLVGTFGLGNRPGRPDFGGGYLWPYGRREMALPIWAHHRNVKYDRIVFQNCKEGWLGWHEIHSSDEPFYCRPVTPAEMNVDTISCPTVAFRTDKGIPIANQKSNSRLDCRELVASEDEKSLYPPRNDLAIFNPARDWDGVRRFGDVNQLDAVSQATPVAGGLHRVTLNLDGATASGDYVVWVEVNQEYDSNDSHAYPFFLDIALPDYGQPSIGQPATVWQVPITIGDEAATAITSSYAGYAAPDGADGNLRAPDATISSAEGSGAGRLVTRAGAEGDFQVRVVYVPDAECPSPPPISGLRQAGGAFDSVDIAFVSTAADTEAVARYEIRYALGSDAIAGVDDFFNAIPGPMVTAVKPGEAQNVRLDQLQPSTEYTVAVRTVNACQEASPLITANIATPERVFATVDACFIATAAYGSIDDEQVVTLRGFRDRVLLNSVLGRQLVDTYYAVSPPIAALVAKHDSLRWITRAALTPVVYAVQVFE